MSRPSVSATPCPVGHPPSGLRRLSALSSIGQDDTADLEYTRAITEEFKNAKPKRRATFQRRERKDAPITIFEDVVEDQELVVAETKREIGGSTLLGKAAKRMPRKSMAVQHEESVAEVQAVEIESERYGARRASTLADSIPGLRFKMPEPAKDAIAETRPQGGLKKDPRRRTIFVPSDDTTMLTIHPGANTTERLFDTFQLPSPPRQRQAPPQQPLPAQNRLSPKPTSKRPGMSLAVAPKRLPLQQMAAEAGNVPAIDVAGQNGGKENLPPGGQVTSGEKKPVSRLYAPTTASQARGSLQSRKAAPLKAGSVRARSGLQSDSTTSRQMTSRQGMSESRSGQPRPAVQQSRSQLESHAAIAPPKNSMASSRSRGVSHLSHEPRPSRPSPKNSPPSHLRSASSTLRPKSQELKTAKLQQYPVLSEDLAQPDLYEDDWLRHQEVALTEVINELFSNAHRKEDQWHDSEMPLRERLVYIYHQPHVSTLHQRIQASLLYGALSRPKDLPCPPLPAQDLGLRKRFLGFWLDSYHEDALSHAAEVVFGRQIPRKSLSDGFRAAEGVMDPGKERRALVGFLQTFLIENTDQEADSDDNGRWRKMISRSLMLIWLLDQASTQRAVSGCLFKQSSPRKTSTQMLYALAGMLMPSIGDVTRTLRHLDYEVSYQQDPLDEVKYHVSNIATGMRDGIYLARLVELLLFSAQNLRTRGLDGEDATITLSLPGDETLSSLSSRSTCDQGARILSQHLKMPALGRAQKLFNVELALSALHSYGRLGDIAATIQAEDIVDGHREKTLSLLWQLVSTYGLETLLDFRELIADIRRHSPSHQDELPQNPDYLSQHEQESLLQTWASVLCAKENIQVTNLTTSFANSRAYAAIIAAFAPFCPSLSGPSTTTATARLRALGCSVAFTASLTSPTSTISNRQTTLSNLAFLASRLLPLKRQYNAATTLQRVWRLRLLRVQVSRRVKLMRLAHACAMVVQTREKVVRAAVVLQRAWGRVLGQRIERLEGEVRSFQMLARGWAVRRGLRGVGTAGRVMGGW